MRSTPRCGAAERDYLLVDTAGVRRRSKVDQHIERASVVRALRALERAEVALLVIDAVEGMTEQDARVAGYAWERGRALVLLVNKWDAVPAAPKAAATVAAEIDRRYPSLAVVPKLFISARSGRGVERIWGAIDAVVAAHRSRLPTAKVNTVFGRPPRPGAADGQRRPPAPLLRHPDRHRAADGDRLLQPPAAHRRQLRALRGQQAARRLRARGHAAAGALQGAVAAGVSAALQVARRWVWGGVERARGSLCPPRPRCEQPAAFVYFPLSLYTNATAASGVSTRKVIDSVR